MNASIAKHPARGQAPLPYSMVEAANQRLLSRKTLNSMGGVLNEQAAEGATGGFGARMLAKFGWKDGEGLGKRNDGITDHIRVKQRKDGVGLGADAPAPSEWAPPPSRAPRRSSDSDEDSSEDEEEIARRQRIASSSGVLPGVSDDALFAICGGARLGMRARATQGGKLARMEAADQALLQAKASSGGGPPTTTRTSPRLAAMAASSAAVPAIDLAAADDKAARKAARKAAKKAAKKASKKAAAATEAAEAETAADSKKRKRAAGEASGSTGESEEARAARRAAKKAKRAEKAGKVS